MYRKDINHQFTLADFNQPVGLKMNADNRWIVKASLIPWEKFEDQYARKFKSKTGMPAKSFRMALGALLIQKEYGWSDRELVAQITENPYLQYFIGLPGYQQEPPFVPSLLVEFRKRISPELIMEINEILIQENTEDDSENDDDSPSSGCSSGDQTSDKASRDKNKGVLILDATCAPQYIEYPQDFQLLNEARENLESIIDRVCEDEGLEKPRTYRKKARDSYLALSKRRKRSKKAIRKTIKQQLQFIRRDLGYIDTYLDNGIVFSEKELVRLDTIRKVYYQQKHMLDNNTHSVEDRIVSLSQPYIRPIVRGKASAPVEFGAKLDLSVENGMARIEKFSFDAYNESEVLHSAVNRFYERNGCYPEALLADTIYRTRANISYCRERGIRLSGPALGRQSKSQKAASKKQQYIDSVNRIEVERSFSLCKRKFGLGCVTTKREDTTKASVYLSVLAMNLDRLARLSHTLFYELVISMFKLRINRSLSAV